MCLYPATKRSRSGSIFINRVLKMGVSNLFAPRKKPSARRNVWGGRTFRFDLRNFLPGAGFSLRRFSIAEAGVFLMMAMLASRVLGVGRQVNFKAIFGAGPQGPGH